MKILYIYDNMPGIYQEYLMLLLIELKRKINVKALSYDDDSRSDYRIKSFGVKDKLQRLAYKLNISSYSSLDHKIMNKYDVIHLQHSFLFSKVRNLLQVNPENRAKIVITLRGGDTYIKPWLSKRWSDFYKNEGQNVDAFITMSQHQKKYLQKWGIPESKIHVIPISFGEFSKPSPKSINRNCIHIVSAYRMCWEKNIEGNLRTIKVLLEKGINVKYDIFGDGPDAGQIYYFIDKYNLQKHAIYHGKITNLELKDRLNKYDFFLQLSHSEALSTSVLEAQSQGVPCIVSNNGGLPEAILDGETGYCVESYDVELAVKKIIELYQNPENFKSFSKKAIDFVNNNFTVKHECERLIKLYSDLYSK